MLKYIVDALASVPWLTILLPWIVALLYLVIKYLGYLSNVSGVNSKDGEKEGGDETALNDEKGASGKNEGAEEAEESGAKRGGLKGFLCNFTKFISLNSKALTKQPVLWVIIIIPSSYLILFFLFLGYGKNLVWSRSGVESFLKVTSDLWPLVAVTVALVALLARMHATIQSEEQLRRSAEQLEVARNSLEASLSKNNYEVYMKHTEQFKEALNDYFTVQDGALINVNFDPRRLYLELYPRNGMASFDFNYDDGFVAKVNRAFADSRKAISEIEKKVTDIEYNSGLVHDCPFGQCRGAYSLVRSELMGGIRDIVEQVGGLLSPSSFEPSKGVEDINEFIRFYNNLESFLGAVSHLNGSNFSDHVKYLESLRGWMSKFDNINRYVNAKDPHKVSVEKRRLEKKSESQKLLANLSSF